MSVDGFADRTEAARASFVERFFAYLIDVVILNVAGYILLRLVSGAPLLGDLVLVVGYFTLFEGSRSGQTPGKRALNIRVVDEASGGPIDFGRALVRNLVRLISGLAILLGYLWMLWDPRGQTWHDKAASTNVVRLAR